MSVSSGSVTLSGLKKIPSLDLGQVTIRLETDPPSSELRDIARQELRETPDLVRESMEALRDLLKDDEDLKVPFENEPWLIRFLRPCKFYPQSAYELIKRYYDFKVKHSGVYDGLLPSKEKNIFSHNILTVLPNRDQAGRRILILELGKKWKHNKVSLDEVYKGAVLFMEAALYEPETQICGVQVIFDMDGLSLQQVWQFTPPFAKRIIDLLQEAIPIRLKGFHIVNQPYIFNMVFALFKPFLKDKLRSRIVFHGTDRDSLHNYISPKCLPECYGGTLDLPRVTGNQWYDLLSTFEEEYKVINSYGIKKHLEGKK
ncbi:alpha-tocopherol transfer protein-like [Anabrus simplex]|uniref:alpha-tocopherol transfer protein-like n=1 Tax=Anabrus simplex TaxID=316456 RepID=UPI0034DDA93E